MDFADRTQHKFTITEHTMPDIRKKVIVYIVYILPPDSLIRRLVYGYKKRGEFIAPLS